MRKAGLEARRFQISGRVQGVGFRRFVIESACDLGLSGSIRNLGNGDVEVRAEGSPAALGELAGLLAVGPRLARVDRTVEEETVATGRFHGFTISG